MEMQQLKRMGKRELVRLVQECDDENRKLAEESNKKQSRIAELEQIVANMHGHITEMEAKQKDMQIKYQEPGSLADSMIQVNGVIEAAQGAAKQYLERIREMETVKQKEAEGIVDMARHEAERIVLKAKAGATQIQEASTNVLQNLQVEIDRMLAGARGEYEQGIARQTPVFETEAPVHMDEPQGLFEQTVPSEPEKVPRLNDILQSVTVQRGEEPVIREESVSADTGAFTGDQPIGEAVAAVKEDDFTSGLSDEIKSVIDDLTYKTQHLGQQTSDTH